MTPVTSGDKGGPAAGSQPQEADVLRTMLNRPEYRRALVFCGLIGIPVALVAFWFLVALNKLERLIWTEWPQDLGWKQAPGGGGCRC